MRHNKRVDANQPEIVKALRKAGYPVLILSQCGHGVPDISVLVDAEKCISLFLEIKDGSKPPSAQGLTEAEKVWRDNHGRNTRTVNSIESALWEVFQFIEELKK